MKSPALLGSRDSLLAEPLYRRGSTCAAPSSYLPAWHVFKERRSSPVFVCRSLLGDAVAAYCSFKPGKSTYTNRVQDVLCEDKRSERLVVVASASITAMKSPDEEWEDFDEYDKALAHYRGLVLDVSYRPINIVCWRRALCLEILEKADVLEYYDQVISSPSKPFPIPAVLRIPDYVYSPVQSKVKLSLNRKNIFLRDKYRCQYCGTRDNLTVDHVVPFSRGGEWTWKNLVTACSECNTRKGNKTPEESKMQLLRTPKEPRTLHGEELPSSYSAFRSMQNSRRVPTEWAGYLPKRFRPMDYF